MQRKNIKSAHEFTKGWSKDLDIIKFNEPYFARNTEKLASVVYDMET